MTTLLILAILGQVRYADEFASSPAVRPSAVAEPAPFPARALPAALRAAPPAVLPDLPDQVFAPAPLPPLPDEVFAPTPRRRIIRVVDRPATEPEPTPGIRRPAGDDESRVDALERNRVAAGDRAALKLKSCSPYICNCNAGGECRAPDGCHCGPDHGPGLHHAATATPQAVTPVVKAWRGILGEPGVQGFGPLNEKGEIVVERRRFTPVPVSAPVPPPVTYATYPQPVVYQEPAPVYGVPTYGAPLGGILGGGCAGGACGVSGGRGVFGGLFR